MFTKSKNVTIFRTSPYYTHAHMHARLHVWVGGQVKVTAELKINSRRPKMGQIRGRSLLQQWKWPLCSKATHIYCKSSEAYLKCGCAVHHQPTVLLSHPAAVASVPADLQVKLELMITLNRLSNSLVVGPEVLTPVLCHFDTNKYDLFTLDPFQCHRLSSTESFGAVSSCHSNSQT
jgi:hypothetical protein